MSDLPPNIQRELDKARGAARGAMAGREGGDAYAAGVRASWQEGVPDMQRSVPALRAALGTMVDAGSFFLGMQTAVLLLDVDQLDIVKVASHPVTGPLLREAVEAYREACP